MRVPGARPLAAAAGLGLLAGVAGLSMAAPRTTAPAAEDRLATTAAAVTSPVVADTVADIEPGAVFAAVTRKPQVVLPRVPTRKAAADGLPAANHTVLRGLAPLAPREIPARAMSAYQFAEVTLAKADPDCGVRWSLVAALARVESDHGTAGSSELRDDGTMSRLARGVVLNGRHDRVKVPDTDHGQLDGNRRWDRGVGPFQLMPATWAAVGVDADSDGRRSPDDLDDAALGTAVFLCAVGDEARTTRGMKQALGWFNTSPAYGRTVRQLEREYRDQYGETPYLASVQPSLLVDAEFVGGPLPSVTMAAADREVGRAARVIVDKATGGGKGTKGPGKHGNAGKDKGHKGGTDGKDGATAGHNAPEHLTDGAATRDPEPGPTQPPVRDDSPSPEPSPAPEPGPSPGPSPGPEPDPGPTPDPDPSPSPEPAPAPSPSPAPEPPAASPTPDVVTVSGTLTTCSQAFCLDGVRLSFPSGWLGGTAPADLDHDGVIESRFRELLGRQGTTIGFRVVAGSTPLRVVSFG